MRTLTRTQLQPRSGADWRTAYYAIESGGWGDGRCSFELYKNELARSVLLEVGIDCTKMSVGIPVHMMPTMNPDYDGDAMFCLDMIGQA